MTTEEYNGSYSHGNASASALPMPPEAIRGNAKTVFISYSTKNPFDASLVCGALENAGIRCWVAPRDLLAGTNFANNIEIALGNAKMMVLVLSHHSAKSPWVEGEINTAFSARKPILVFRIDDVELEGSLKLMLGRAPAIQKTGISRNDRAAIAENVFKILNGQPTDLQPLHIQSTPAVPAPESPQPSPFPPPRMSVPAQKFSVPAENETDDKSSLWKKIFIACGVVLLCAIVAFLTVLLVPKSSPESVPAKRLTPEEAEKEAIARTMPVVPEVVEIPGRNYKIGKYEVTNFQLWTIFDNQHCLENWKHTNNYPTGSVSWQMCVNYCRKLTEYARAQGVISQEQEFRLPTSEEWEFACRAGTTTKFYTGDSESDLLRAGWVAKNSENRVHPVGLKTPNAWGIYDMHGNVWERVLDLPDHLRGGAFDSAMDANSANEFLWRRDARQENIGFRVVLAPVAANSVPANSVPVNESLVTRKFGEIEVVMIPEQDFGIGKTEVTQAQWEEIMGTNPSYFRGNADCPVEQVSWKMALDFCEKLTARERENGNLQANEKFTLPRKEQWEIACRAGTTTRFYNGENESDFARAAWCYQNSGDAPMVEWSLEATEANNCRPHPVAQREPNAFGLYDMYGNVWEMVLEKRAVGGCFNNNHGPADTKHAYVIEPNGGGKIQGFRVALVTFDPNAPAWPEKIAFPQKASSKLATQVKIAENRGNASLELLGENAAKKFQIFGAATSVNDAGNLEFSGERDGTSDARLKIFDDSETAKSVTVFVKAKMKKARENAASDDNFLGIFLGNGKTVGAVFLGEEGIFWNGTTPDRALYLKPTTDDFQALRIAYFAGTRLGAGTGFYVWLGNELIGEALPATDSEMATRLQRGNLLLGDASNSHQTRAEISKIALEIGNIFAPPEKLSPPRERRIERTKSVPAGTQNAQTQKLQEAFSRGDLLAAEKALAAGANPDENALLVQAARAANADFVELLLCYGATPDLVEKSSGNDAFTAAVTTTLDVFRVVELLCDYGFPVNGKNAQGDRFLSVAQPNKRGRIAELMLNFGANPDAPGDDGTTPRQLAQDIGNAYWIDLYRDTHRTKSPTYGNGREFIALDPAGTGKSAGTKKKSTNAKSAGTKKNAGNSVPESDDDEDVLAESEVDFVAKYLVDIPEGTFANGTRVAAFKMGKTEITQAQWLKIMGKNPSENRGENLPVERITYTEALEFCEKLTARERKAGRISSDEQFALPTTTQWKYVCESGRRASDEKLSLREYLKIYAWFDENSGGKTHPVGKKRANALGVFDLHGNVWEFCYSPQGTSAFIAGANSTKGIESRFWRDVVVVPPDRRASDVGLRVVLISEKTAGTRFSSLSSSGSPTIGQTYPWTEIFPDGLWQGLSSKKASANFDAVEQADYVLIFDPRSLSSPIQSARELSKKFRKKIVPVANLYRLRYSSSMRDFHTDYKHKLLISKKCPLNGYYFLLDANGKVLDGSVTGAGYSSVSTSRVEAVIERNIREEKALKSQNKKKR